MLLLALLAVGLHAQADVDNQLIFRPITASGGIADNSAQTIECTYTGRIVITTIGTINFYDGANFSTINPDNEVMFKLDDYKGHYHLYFDNNHHLWLKSSHAVSCVNLTTEQYVQNIDSIFALYGSNGRVKDMFVDKNGSTTFEPLGVYVCNHPWPYYGCLHGDGMGRAFEEGDYFELVAHGVAADGTETTVSMNLVEFTNGELIAANDWTYFDLSNLGEVESVYFTMNSTDTGAYGMNTAAYFCMDKFQVKGEDGGDTPEPPTPTEKTQTPDGSYAVTPGQHEVVVTITPYEGDVYYRILYTAPDRYTSESDWMLYEAPFAVNEYGSYRIEFYAIAPGKLPSDPGAVEFSVGPMTGVEEMTAGKTVAGVRYFNAAGQEMQQANGLTIVVTTYTDGTSTAVKVMK